MSKEISEVRRVKGFEIDGNSVEDWHLTNINKATILQLRASLSYIKYHKFKLSAMLKSVRNEVSSIDYTGPSTARIAYLTKAIKESKKVLQYGN